MTFLRTGRAKAGALLVLVLLVAGCVPILDAIFGDPVPVDESDTSPPTVRILINDIYLTAPEGDFSVMSADRRAIAWGPSFTFGVAGDDPQGIRYVGYDDIEITARCRNSGTSPTYVERAYRTLPGDRVENTGAEGRATTRLLAIKRVVVDVDDVETRCGSPYPVLSEVVVRLKGIAGHFGTQPEVSTGTARISISPPAPPPSGGIVVPPRPPRDDDDDDDGDEEDDEPTEGCAGEGSSCTVTPAECSLRGDDFEVPGTIVCRRGEPVCEAEEGVDYCTRCGGANFRCGGCSGNSCTDDDDCSILSVCSRGTGPSGVNVCRSLLTPEVLGAEPRCSPGLSGRCWLPSELGNSEVQDLLCRIP